MMWLTMHWKQKLAILAFIYAVGLMGSGDYQDACAKAHKANKNETCEVGK